MILTIDFRGAKKDMLDVHPSSQTPDRTFIRRCLFHSLNRSFQNHTRAIPALQSRRDTGRGRCACPPWDIQCTDTVPGEPMTF